MKLWKTVLRLVYGDFHVQHTCAYLLVSSGLVIVIFIDSTL